MYIVWTKESFQDTWQRTDCDNLTAVEEVIRANFLKEVEVEVTTPVKFSASIAVKIDAVKELPPPTLPELEPEKETEEVKTVEAPEGGPEEDQSPRGKSHKSVR